MLKNLFFPFLLSLAVFFQSCNGGYEKTESGLKYKLIQDSAGTNAKMGDLVIAHLKYQNEKDTVDTYKHGQPANIILDSAMIGALAEGLTKASKGDSIEILMSNETLYLKLSRNDSLPKGIKPGTFTVFHFKILDVKSKDQVNKDRAERQKRRTDEGIAFMNKMKQQIIDSSQAQLKIDDAKIQAYLKKNKLTAQRTETGVYYIISQEGTGAQPGLGDSVVLQYTGKFLDGKEFDKSAPERPLAFQVGVGAVIPGFDEAVMQLKEGSKATVFIPSPLAYGKQGAKRSETEYAIPPDSPIMFDLELVKVTKRKL